MQMVGMADYARPDCYQVQLLSGIGYVVLAPSGQVIRDSQTPFRLRAEQQRDALQREADLKAKRFDRPCLCCGRVFPSAGIHNRMCDVCRRQSFALADESRPSLPRARGGRS